MRRRGRGKEGREGRGVREGEGEGEGRGGKRSEGEGTGRGEGETDGMRGAEKGGMDVRRHNEIFRIYLCTILPCTTVHLYTISLALILSPLHW